MTKKDCKPRDEESKTVASSLANDRDFVRALLRALPAERVRPAGADCQATSN